MDISRAKRGAFYLWLEESFGVVVDEADRKYWKVEESTFPTDRTKKSGNDVTIGDDEDRGVHLRNPASITVKSQFHPICRLFPTSEFDMDNDPIPPDSSALYASLGGVVVGKKTLTAAGSTASMIQLAEDAYIATPSESFPPGSMLVVHSASNQRSNVLAAARVKSVDDVLRQVTLTAPLPPLACNPPTVTLAAGLVVHGILSFYKKPLPSAITVGMERKGEKEFDMKRAIGAVPSSCKIEFPNDDTASITFSFNAAKIFSPKELDAAGELGVPVDEAFPFPDAPQAFCGGLWAYIKTSTAEVNTPVHGSFSIDLGIEANPLRGCHDTDPNGVAGWSVIARKIRVSMTPFYVGSVPFGLYDPEENDIEQFTVTGWAGPRGECFAFCVPAAELQSNLDEGDSGGDKTLDLVVSAGQWLGDGDGETDYEDDESGNKPFVCGWLAGS